MTNRKLRVLILYPTRAFFDTILLMAEILQSDGGSEVIVFCHARFTEWEDLEGRAAAVGVKLLTLVSADGSRLSPERAIRDIGLVLENDRLRSAPPPIKSVPPFQVRLLRMLNKLLHTTLVKQQGAKHDASALEKKLVAAEKKLAREISIAGEVLDLLDIDLLVSVSESISHQTPQFLCAAKPRGIRSLFIPISFPSHNEVDGWMKRNSRSLISSRFDRMFALLFPKWIRRIDGKKYARLPVPDALAYEVQRIVPRSPWQSFTAPSDIMGCSSEYMRDHLVKMGAGFRRNATVVLGAPEDDRALVDSRSRAEIRADLSKRFGIDPAKPILLFSVPSDVSNQYPHSEFTDFNELIAYWCQSFGTLKNVSTIVSPHPWYRHNQEKRHHLEKSCFNVSWQSVNVLMRAADLFCTFGASSTPRLAAAQGLPVLNYIPFRRTFGPEDDRAYFVGLDTMPVADSKQEWEALLKQVDDAEWRDALGVLARAKARHFGVPRGDFSDRFIKLSRSLGAEKGPLHNDDLRLIQTICSEGD